MATVAPTAYIFKQSYGIVFIYHKSDNVFNIFCFNTDKNTTYYDKIFMDVSVDEASQSINTLRFSFIDVFEQTTTYNTGINIRNWAQTMEITTYTTRVNDAMATIAKCFHHICGVDMQIMCDNTCIAIDHDTFDQLYNFCMDRIEYPYRYNDVVFVK